MMDKRVCPEKSWIPAARISLIRVIITMAKKANPNIAKLINNNGFKAIQKARRYGGVLRSAIAL